MNTNNEYYINQENSILEEGPTKSMVQSYHGEFQKYKPKFKARPANYYPNTCEDRCIQFLMLIPAWVMCGVLLYAFTYWGLQDTHTFGYICISVWVVYIVVIGKFIKKTKRNYFFSFYFFYVYWNLI